MGSKGRGPAAMVEEERASTSSEPRHRAEGEVGGEHVTATSRAGATVEERSGEAEASEDMVGSVDRVGPGNEIQEAGGSSRGKLPLNEERGVHGSTRSEGSGSSVAVQADMKGDSERKVPCLIDSNVVEVVHDEIIVEFDGEERRTYSVDEFGRILQTSQWSLAHRIEVCKVLECNEFNAWRMTPLSMQEYAKQSLALVKRPGDFKVNDISECNCRSFEAMSSSVKKELDEEATTSTGVNDYERERMESAIWEKHWSKLSIDVEGHVFRNWKELRMLLEEELERVRNEDKLEKWYKGTFEGQQLQPWQIYAAVEKGQADTAHKMMEDIGEKHWGKLKPREYRGATPLHWAALHNQVDQRLWGLIVSMNPWPEELFDDFGFKPVHMAIFASSFLPVSNERPGDMAIFASSFLPESNERPGDISRCLEMIDGYAAVLTGDPQLDPREGEKLNDILTWELPRRNGTYGWNFEVCPLTRSTNEASKWIDSTSAKGKRIDSSNTSGNWSGFGDINGDNFFIFKLIPQKEKRKDKIEYKFIAKCYFNIPIHPLHLAIWIGHPLVVEKLIHLFKGMRLFSLETDNGDSILHLAFKAMDFEERKPMRKTHNVDLPPNFGDEMWSEDYVAKGMSYVLCQRVMLIIIRFLHYYPQMLNLPNKDEQTPLHIAIFQGNMSCVTSLLRCEYANYSIKNKKAVTPLQMLLKLRAKDSKECRMYANILGSKCALNEEFGFSTVKCNDVWYLGAYDDIFSHLMQELEPEIVRQWHILQLSEWSDKHRIYALQMLDENHVGLERIKDTYIEQCKKMINESYGERWDKRIEAQSIDNVNKLQQLKWTFINISKSSFDSLQGTFEEGVYTAIEDGDWYKFQRLSNDSTRKIFCMKNEHYQLINPLDWAVVNGKVKILGLMFEKLTLYKESAEDLEEHRIWSEMIDIARNNFGFTCLHLAIFYSFIRLDERYGRFLHSDEGFASIDPLHSEVISLRTRKQNSQKDIYNWMIQNLNKTGFCCTDSASASRRSTRHFVVWNINLTDSINIDYYLSTTNLYPIHLALHCAQPNNFQRLLENTPDQAWFESSIETGDTILHYAEGWEVLLRHCSKFEWGQIEPILLKHLHSSKAVNSRNWNRETPLHRAVRTKSPKWVEVLLQFEHLRFNLRDQEILTPGDYAPKMLQETPSNLEAKKIVDLLDCYDPESWPRKRMSEEKLLEEERKETERLYRERQVYVDAGNAILVGGALIASASFGAWLQPPLGLHPYYSPEFLDTSAPPALGPTYDSYVAIKQHWTIQLFWIFNSLSFFFSLATVIAGADAALPHQEVDANRALDSVKRAVKLAAWLLIASILAVIGTFATVGFTVLPPISKYRVNMICTVVVGGVACVAILIKLIRKLCS